VHAQVIVPLERDAFYVRMAGRVLSRTDGKSVPFSTVYNRVTKKGVVADSSGFFSLVISSKDTLEIRHVGFRPLLYVKPSNRNANYYEEIYLPESFFELKEVTIYRKRKVLETIALNPEYERTDPFQIYLFGAGKPRSRTPASFSSPISAIYESFSRREQNLRKLEVLKANRQLQELARIRYNEYYVESLTGLKGQDLAAFMGYCPMQPNFIISASDYELAAAVLNCYRRFMNDL
jgi:hypothetical protein